MDLKRRQEIAKIVAEVVKPANPISHQVRRQLSFGRKGFRVQPDENFEFSKGHLLIEYEQNKRPVESISKYWWLFYKSEWPAEERLITLVIFLLNDWGNSIRSETVELLGRELEKRLPNLFVFFFVPPNAIGYATVRNVLNMALAKVN